MRYPPHEDYAVLYKRFFQNVASMGFLFPSSLDYKNGHVLDLCGGGGRATRKAIELGAAMVTFVDQEPQMIPHDFYSNSHISVRKSTVEDFLIAAQWDKYDHVVCQQGINYWFAETPIRQLAAAMHPGARFCFNTFNMPPAYTPTVKEYEIEHKKYAEIYYLVGEVVHHVQTVDGYPPHVTSFKYVSPDTYREILKRSFSEVRNWDIGTTSYWECKK